MRLVETSRVISIECTEKAANEDEAAEDEAESGAGEPEE